MKFRRVGAAISLTLRRFFRTPKGMLVILLVLITAIAAAGEGARLVAPLLAGSVAAAMLVDTPLLRHREGKWLVPDGAFLSGLIVALILSPHERWWVGAIASVVAVLSKYAARVGRANVFNPAAFALVATFYVFDTGQSWWGALSDMPPSAIIVLFATGIFIMRRVNKTAAAIAFLGVYYALFTITAFVGNPAHVAAVYRAPDLHAALFFAFFMVTDPPTSPPKARDQVVFGAITAIVAYASFELIGAAYFLLAGLLAANVWEAWRKRRTRRAHRERVAAASPLSRATPRAPNARVPG
ncbi:MAG TPA: RnfABCDGE type electron transport complex subunit D [Gemmatimonadaceae bacterium]|jgi:Na+-translocating ferredoxin:NAD+ oxidoreductase RnfD subunit|nr:RnfABCDGE type electron transport complex subunit D [Gemmatimonadaceae bacterium]